MKSTNHSQNQDLQDYRMNRIMTPFLKILILTVFDFGLKPFPPLIINHSPLTITCSPFHDFPDDGFEFIGHTKLIGTIGM